MPPNPTTALRLVKTLGGNVSSRVLDVAQGVNTIVGALTGRTTAPITILGDLTLNGATTTTDPINTSSYIDFTAIATPATPAANHARLYGEVVQGHTRMAFLDDDGIDMVVTRDNAIVVRNTSGSDMTKGQAVYVTGSTGNVPTVALAKADSLTTLPSIGLLLQDTANNAFGMCMLLGVLSAFDTSAWSTGDRLFVSATTAGALTNARPVSPLYAQRIGSVLVDGVGNGSIDVTTVPFIGGEETGTTATTWTAAGAVTIAGQLKYTFGTEGANLVLTSDADGNATWESSITTDVLTANSIVFNGGGASETTFSVTIPAASTTNDGDNLLLRAGAAGPGSPFGGTGGDLYLAGGGAGGGTAGSVYLGWDGSVASLRIFAKANFYPGGQTTRYISDDATYTFISGGLKLGAALYPGDQTTHYITGGASGIGIDVAPAQLLELSGGNISLGREAASTTFTRYIGLGGTAGDMVPGSSGGCQIGFNTSGTGAGQGETITFLTHSPGVSHAVRMTIDNVGNIRFHAYGAGALSTDASGNITASDARLKDIQRPFARGLADLLKLSPVVYRWTKESGCETENEYAAFTAQDVQRAIPEAVVGARPDGMLNYSDRTLIAVLVNAIKENHTRIARLEAQVGTQD